MSRTTRLNKTLTAAVNNVCNTMTIDTQVINKTKYKIRQYTDIVVVVQRTKRTVRTDKLVLTSKISVT